MNPTIYPVQIEPKPQIYDLTSPLFQLKTDKQDQQLLVPQSCPRTNPVLFEQYKLMYKRSMFRTIRLPSIETLKTLSGTSMASIS